MLQAGDEVGRTQQENNNAYCQDNEIAWIDWKLDRPRQELLDYTRFLTTLFRKHHSLRRGKSFHGREIRNDKTKDLSWLRPDGQEMTDEDWSNPETHSIGELLAGDAIEGTARNLSPRSLARSRH
jgi:glycogen operon protein